MSKTFEQVIGEVINIPALVKANEVRLQTVACSTVLGNLLQRIFNKGEAADGGLIGPTLSSNRFGAYSEKYGRLRKDRGRRVDKVDLQFGGTLFESIQLGTSNGKQVIGITSEKQTEIAERHEKVNFKKPIFRATEKEIEIGFKALQTNLDIIIRNIIQGGANAG
jgi:hypothetical protein